MQKINSENVIYNIDSKYENDFSNYEIEGDVIVNIRSNKILKFNNSKILGTFRISYEAQAHVDIDFENAEVFNELIINIYRGRINLKSTNLHAGANIRSKDISLNLSHARIHGIVDICDSKFSTIDLSNIEYSSKTEDDKFIFKNNIVEGKTNASKSTFQNATFSETEFANVANFDNSIFLYSVLPGSGNFFNTIFKGDAYFNNVNFDKGTFFNGSIFYGTALFVGLNKKTECVGDYSGVIFHKRSFFDFSKFESIAFHNCEFIDVASFKNFASKELEISKAFFLKGADFLNSSIKRADRETFRIIKNEFLKINNQVEALHFRSKEMKAYEREIKSQGLTSERVLLWINRISNEYGLNWLRGIKFTFSVGIIFYVFYLFSLRSLPFDWGWVSFGSFLNAVGITIKYFFRFFLPTHSFEFMNEFAPTALSFFIDFLAKIFVGFGIYQTIQAFRKFRKN